MKYDWEFLRNFSISIIPILLKKSLHLIIKTFSSVYVIETELRFIKNKISFKRQLFKVTLLRLLSLIIPETIELPKNKDILSENISVMDIFSIKQELKQMLISSKSILSLFFISIDLKSQLEINYVIFPSSKSTSSKSSLFISIITLSRNFRFSKIVYGFIFKVVI